MTDLDTRIRELIYRLVETAPEPPPFPTGPGPRRTRRPALVWAAATVVVVALIALPVLFLLPTSDEPATSVVGGSGPEATVPPATVPAATSQASPNVIAFFDTGFGEAEVQAVAAEVRTWDGVTAVLVVTRSDALDEARALFADEPGILQVLEDDPSVLPWSVRIRAAWSQLDAVAARLESVPGVARVVAADLAELLQGEEAVDAAEDEATVPTPAVPALPPAGLTLSADRGVPGDEVTICGAYTGESEVSLDVGHPATGYRWAEPIRSTIEVGDDGAWCWTGVVPGSLLDLGPQGEDVTVAVQPGTYEVRASSYPEDYSARTVFVIEGVGPLGVSIDQGWSYVSTQPEILISGSAFGHDRLRLFSQRRGDLEVEIVERDGGYQTVVPLVPGADVIQVLAESDVTQQHDAVAEIAVRYLPEAVQRAAFLVEVRPAAGEIVVDFAELLQGEEAFAAAAADGATVSPLTGLYVDNPEERSETVPIEANPPFVLWSPDEVPIPRQVTYEEWYGSVLDLGVPRDPAAGEAPDPAYFGAGLVGAPYWLTIHEGTVVQVELLHVG